MDTITSFALTQPSVQSSATSAVRPLALSNVDTEEKEKSAAAQVFLSDSANNKNTAEQRMVEKYEAAVTSVREQQENSPAQSDTTQVHSGRLEDLPPIKLFNEADVKEYEKHLMSELSRRGIDISQPMNLGFDFEGNVVVQNDHPDKAAIEAAFKDDMDLRNGLVQTSNHYLFKEMYALHQQWVDKINSGVSEEVANIWLINTVQSAVNKSSQGITLSEQGFQDPFASSNTSSVAMKAYQL
jgi:hypothetical protein